MRGESFQILLRMWGGAGVGSIFTGKEKQRKKKKKHDGGAALSGEGEECEAVSQDGCVCARGAIREINVCTHPMNSCGLSSSSLAFDRTGRGDEMSDRAQSFEFLTVKNRALFLSVVWRGISSSLKPLKSF